MDGTLGLGGDGFAGAFVTSVPSNIRIISSKAINL